PMSLAEPFLRIKEKGSYTENDLLFQGELYHSKFHHGAYCSTHKESLLQTLNEGLQTLEKKLKSSKFLFISLGTAFVYRFKETHEIAANCHKIPASNFSKEILSQGEIVELWSGLLAFFKQQYPQLNIVFTVSPVKHLSDGIIENSRSKSILISAVHELVDSANISYFPAYELISEDLRDY